MLSIGLGNSFWREVPGSFSHGYNWRPRPWPGSLRLLDYPPLEWFFCKVSMSGNIATVSLPGDREGPSATFTSRGPFSPLETGHINCNACGHIFHFVQLCNPEKLQTNQSLGKYYNSLNTIGYFGYMKLYDFLFVTQRKYTNSCFIYFVSMEF